MLNIIMDMLSEYTDFKLYEVFPSSWTDISDLSSLIVIE